MGASVSDFLCATWIDFDGRMGHFIVKGKIHDTEGRGKFFIAQAGDVQFPIVIRAS